MVEVCVTGRGVETTVTVQVLGSAVIVADEVVVSVFVLVTGSCVCVTSIESVTVFVT